MDKDFYWLWLCNIKGVWNGTIEGLLKIFNSPEEIYRADSRTLEKALELIKTNNKKMNYMENIVLSRNYDRIMRLRESLNKKGIYFIHINNKCYPEKLRGIKGHPYGIYLKGKQKDIQRYDEKRRAVAVVGARNCSSYGRKMAHEISFTLAANGVDIISGMARGIDSEGHWGAIDAGGTTCAVMGCGVDVCYPRENIELYERILERGCILSDYPAGTEPLAWQFPFRNRIISALADRILVVEAKEKSGSLITVSYGLEQGKDVYAVPGRADDVLSAGCNRLIREGAGIAVSAEDILIDLGIKPDNKAKKTKNKKIVLEKDLETLYSFIDFLPKSIHTLLKETGRDSMEIFRDLVKLQMMGLIEEPSKNYYSKKT